MVPVSNPFDAVQANTANPFDQAAAQLTPKAEANPFDSVAPESKKIYDRQGLADLWVKNGGDPHVADFMAEVALNESGGSPNATGVPYKDQGKTWRAHGLWQISDIHGDKNWNDPVTNVKQAIELFRAQGTAPWEASRDSGAYGGWGKTAAAKLYVGSAFDDSVKAARKAAQTQQPPKPPPKGDPIYNIPGTFKHPTEAGFITASAAEDFGNTMNHLVMGLYHQMVVNAQDPLGAAYNLEQTPARAWGTLLQHGLTPQSLRDATYNAFNPGVGDQDTNDVVAKIMGAIHRVDQPVAGIAHTLLSIAAQPGIEQEQRDKTSNPALFAEDQEYDKTAPLSPGNFRRTAELFLAQTIADPVSYIPVIDVLGRMTGATRTLRTMADAAKEVGGAKVAKPFMDAHGEVVKKYAGALHRVFVRPLQNRPELDDVLEPHAKAGRIGSEEAARAQVMDELGHTDALLMAQSDDAFKTVENISKMTPDEQYQAYARAMQERGGPRAQPRARVPGDLTRIISPESGVTQHSVAADTRVAPEGALPQRPQEPAPQPKAPYQYGAAPEVAPKRIPSEPPAVEKPGLPENVRLNDPYLDYSQYTLTPEQALQRRIETGEGPAIPQHQFAPDVPIGKQPNWAQGSPSVKHDPYGISQLPTQELRDRRLQGMWRYGTPDVRQTAIEMGYNPKPEDAAWMKAPEGRITDSEYRDIAKAGIKEKPKPAPAPPDAPYRFKQTAAQKPEEPIKPKDLKKQVAAQLSAEQDALWKKRADAMTQHYLETQGGWKPEAGAVDIKKLSYGPKTFDSPLKVLGELGTQAVQGIPFAHAINNVGTLTYIAGGAPAIGRSLAYMSKGGPSITQVARLKNLGAFTEYTQDVGNVWSKMNGSRQVLHAGQKVLSKMELSYRQALLDGLDKELGASVDADGNITDLRLEMQKGQAIRDALVDYRNVPLVVELMRAGGAPFAGFFGGLVKAVARGAVRRPDRLAHITRANYDLRQQYGVSIPNPVSTAENLLFEPQVELMNRMGLLGSMFSGRPGEGYHVNSFDQIAGHILESTGGPWLSRIPAFFNEPYRKPGTTGPQLTPVAGLAATLSGAHKTNGPSAYQQRKFEQWYNRQPQDIFDTSGDENP